jgi:hypothetical protein
VADSAAEVGFVEDIGRGADCVGDVGQWDTADAEPSGVIHDCRRWPDGATGPIGADVAQGGQVMQH